MSREMSEKIKAITPRKKWIRNFKPGRNTWWDKVCKEKGNKKTIKVKKEGTNHSRREIKISR